MSRPTLRKGPASAYEAPNEVIREFGDGKGNGGLLSLRILDDGQMIVEIYQVSGPVVVHAPTPKPVIDILTSTHPDEGTTTTVYVDGKLVQPDGYDKVDPGAGYSLTDYRERLLDAQEQAAKPDATEFDKALADTLVEYEDQYEKYSTD
jgi:hypothetical protein